MKRAIVLVCAVAAVLWGVHMYLPSTAQVAYVVPHLQIPITWAMVLGTCVGALFLHWMKAK